jgi:hypothetical protein
VAQNFAAPAELQVQSYLFKCGWSKTVTGAGFTILNSIGLLRLPERTWSPILPNLPKEDIIKVMGAYPEGLQSIAVLRDAFVPHSGRYRPISEVLHLSLTVCMTNACPKCMFRTSYLRIFVHALMLPPCTAPLHHTASLAAFLCSIQISQRRPSKDSALTNAKYSDTKAVSRGPQLLPMLHVV